MFNSFFPNPRVFFLSVLVYTALCVAVWYGYREPLGAMLGFDLSDDTPVIGLGHFGRSFSSGFRRVSLSARSPRLRALRRLPASSE